MYTRVESRFWQDEKMRNVSAEARYLMLYLLTSPHRNVLGFYFLPEPYACFDLGWTQEQFRERLGELLRNGLVKYDETAHVVLIRNFLKHNPLENQNQVKSAIEKLNEIPKTPLFKDFYEAVKKYSYGKSHYSSLLEQLEERLQEQLPQQFGEPFGKQEKEKEEEKEKEINNISDEILSSDETDDTPPPEQQQQKENIPYQQIADLYNRTCLSLPKVEKLTDKRRRHIKTAWKNFKGDISKFEEVFRRAEKSDFLSGRSGKWTGCNFDWLITYNNMVKVLEGTYDNKKDIGGCLNGQNSQYKRSDEKNASAGAYEKFYE